MLKPIVTDTYDFPTLIEGGYVYVDKTALLRRMVSGVDGTQFFICRPRRFGKSLMLSTLGAIFEGRKKLFRGLAIAKSDYDWKTYPVIRLDMSVFDPTIGAGRVCRELSALIAEQMKEAGLKIPAMDSPGTLMGCLITGLAAKSKSGKVVVLVDEYDNPISGLIGRPKELDAMQQALQHFYRTFKVHVGKIRFLMMTGVSKFARLSVFSGLNNLNDLSMRPEYADLLGYTKQELCDSFAGQIRDFAKAEGVAPDQVVGELLSWYDSYRFSPAASVCVCNPVSVGCALMQRRFAGYWDRTGSATFIIERLRRIGKLPSELDGVEVCEDIMDACDPYDMPCTSLMYQAGYLTIKDAKDNGRMVLGIPNREVRQSLYGGFLARVLKQSAKAYESAARALVADLDGTDDAERMVANVLQSVFAMVPHEWKLKNEAEAKRYFLLFMRMAGATINAEVESANGRADAVLEAEKAIYIFEFKYGKSARAALKQIDDRGYAKAYSADRREVVKIGVNYDPKKHAISCEAVNEPVNEPANEPVNEPANEPVNEPVIRSVLRAVKRHPGLRRPSLLKLVETSEASMKRALSSLIAAGRVEFRGAPKTGGYYAL